MVAPGAVLQLEWKITNTGTCVLDQGSGLQFYSGDQMDWKWSPPEKLAPNETAPSRMTIAAPLTAGNYHIEWYYVSPDSKTIGVAPILQYGFQVVESVPDKGSPPPLLQAGTLEQRGADNAPMVFVPAGNFLMGSVDKDSAAQDNEKPQHAVHLDAFWMDQHEVTNAQYAQCVSAGSCQPPSSTASDSRAFYYGNAQFDNYPVIWVSWNDAQNYCAWASKQLPTEAQWEKAARGTDGRIYPWGNEFDPGRLNVNAETKDTMPVGAYPKGASPYGAVDMAGTVFEWAADWFETGYYTNSPRTNPRGPDSGEVRVLRGGAWRNQGDVRTASRTRESPEYRDYYIGFRCVQSVP